MSYERLPFAQYFLDTSGDYNHSGRPFREPDYQALRYPCSGKLRSLLGLCHEVNYAFRYDPERDAIEIHFEKTVGFTDWFANIFEFSSKYYDAISYEECPLQLRVKVAFIWANVDISNFKSGGITDAMFTFPRAQYKDYKFVDKRGD